MTFLRRGRPGLFLLHLVKQFIQRIASEWHLPPQSGQILRVDAAFLPRRGAFGLFLYHLISQLWQRFAFKWHLFPQSLHVPCLVLMFLLRHSFEQYTGVLLPRREMNLPLQYLQTNVQHFSQNKVAGDLALNSKPHLAQILSMKRLGNLPSTQRSGFSFQNLLSALVWHLGQSVMRFSNMFASKYVSNSLYGLI